MNWIKIIKEIRNELLLTQNELAELLGVSFATINRWENGHNEPTVKIKRKIKELAKKYNVNMNFCETEQ